MGVNAITSISDVSANIHPRGSYIGDYRMRTPTIRFVDSGVLDEITAHQPTLTTEQQVRDYMASAIELAEDMAHKGLERLDDVLEPRRKKDKRSAWQNDAVVTRWFGDDRPTVASIRGVRRRLARIRDRLESTRLTVRLRAQPANHPTRRGLNHGAGLTPRRFQLYSQWFQVGLNDEERAAIIVHELLHDRHIDHKVRDDDGVRKTAYGSRLAQLLAEDKPMQARRNPENFEQFVLDVWLNT